MLDYWVPIVVTGGTVGGSFLFLLWNYEGIAFCETRTAFADYLLSSNPDSGQVRLLSVFVAAFDGYFSPSASALEAKECRRSWTQMAMTHLSH